MSPRLNATPNLLRTLRRTRPNTMSACVPAYCGYLRANSSNVASIQRRGSGLALIMSWYSSVARSTTRLLMVRLPWAAIEVCRRRGILVAALAAQAAVVAADARGGVAARTRGVLGVRAIVGALGGQIRVACATVAVSHCRNLPY